MAFFFRENSNGDGGYLSIILHHIRTPLTSMMWAVKELWKEAPEGSSEKERLLKIYDENVRLVHTVEKLLATSRAESGKVSYSFELTNTESVRRLILEGISEMSPSARVKNIALRVEAEAVSGKPLKVDLEKTISIAQTLFENAVNYTDPGGEISVALREREDGKDLKEGGGCLVLEIRDTGIGIPEKDSGKIFTQFFRADNAEQKIPTGHGVGLFLAKTFVEAHGGTIAFAPNQENGGAGTVFTVCFPLARE